MIKQAKDILPKYNIQAWGINPNTELKIEYVDPNQFLTAERIDLICKLIYIDCKVRKINLKFARYLYKEHIRAFSGGTFNEPGNEEKNSIDKYFECFNAMIDSIPKEGLSYEKSVVGVANKNHILDGSHRTAIAIYFKLKLPIVHIETKAIYNYDYSFFLSNGMSSDCLDYLAYQFVRYSNNVFTLCLWPRAKDYEKRRVAEKLISDSAAIVYKKELRLNYNGLFHLMIHAYGNGREEDKWAGSVENGFLGLHEKVKCCYEKNQLTTVYVLSNTSLEKIVEIKDEIRKLYEIQKHSVHVTDTKNEAIAISQVVLNNNSIDLLNYGEPFKFHEFANTIESFRISRLNSALPLENFEFDYNSVLALYGLKDTDNITSIFFKDGFYYSLDSHNRIITLQNMDDVFFDPANYLFFRGLKYVSIHGAKSINKKKNVLLEILLVIKRFRKSTFNQLDNTITKHLIKKIKNLTNWSR